MKKIKVKRKSKAVFGIKCIVAGVLIGQFVQPLPFTWDTESVVYVSGNEHLAAWEKLSHENTEALFVDTTQFAKKD